MMVNDNRKQTVAPQRRSVGSSYRIPSLVATTFVVAFTTAPTSSLTWTKKQTTHGKSIIAYNASWQKYDRNDLTKPSNLQHSKVTRYNFAFFQTNELGQIWGTDAYADPIVLYGEMDWSWAPGQGKPGFCSWTEPGEPPLCQGHKYETGLIYQAHKAGVEIYPSIGGWTLSDLFPTLAKNPTARKAFAANCVKLIEAYDFDGIDIDWEYPGYEEHMGTPEDTQNYSLLLQDIRSALDELGTRKGRVYGLTAALPCGPDLITNIEIGVVSKILTELNLMTYDFHGTWDKKTGPNAPLYDMDGDLPGFSVHSCVETWKAGGGSPDQINIGLPFYGRSFAGSGLTAFGQANAGTADTSSWWEDEGSPQYFNIASKLSSFTSVRDEQTKTQYAYNDVGFVSYDDERAICDKTEYAMDNNLNGYIIWEISGDLMSDLSTPLLDATNIRLNNPDVRCGPVGPGPSNAPKPKPPPTTPTAPVSVPNLPPNDYLAQNPKPTPIPINPSPANGSAFPFYPDFTSDGTSAGCRNDGKAPEWITSDMMKSTRGDCCASYFDPYFSNLWADRCNKGYPYYPNYENHSCVNDGNHPSWMSGDYLADTKWTCCSNAFRDKKLLDKCTSTSL